VSFFQNSFSFVKSSRKSSHRTYGSQPAFSYKSKAAFPKTEVLEKPQV